MLLNVVEEISQHEFSELLAGVRIGSGGVERQSVLYFSVKIESGTPVF